MKKQKIDQVLLVAMLVLLLFTFVGAAADAAGRGWAYGGLDVSELPSTCKEGKVYGVKDGTSATDCTTGGGSTTVGCMCETDSPAAWSAIPAIAPGSGSDEEVTWFGTGGLTSDPEYLWEDTLNVLYLDAPGVGATGRLAADVNYRLAINGGLCVRNEVVTCGTGGTRIDLFGSSGAYMTLSDSSVSETSYVEFENAVNDWRVGTPTADSDFAIQSYDGFLGFYDTVLIEGQAPDNSLYIDSSGQVGLGTSTPGVSLDISSTTPYIELDNTDTGGEAWQIQALTGGLVITDVGSGATEFKIQDDGKVGINTSSPSYLLEVKSQSTSSVPFRVSASDGSLLVKVDETSAGDGQLRVANAAGTSKVVFDAAGNSGVTGGDFGLGTLSPSQDVHVWRTGETLVLRLESATDNTVAFRMGDNAQDWQWQLPAGGTTLQLYDVTGATAPFKVEPAAADTLVVDGADRVGIGTSSPATTLDVATATAVLRLNPHDAPPTCAAGTEGGVYYDASLNELCFCNASSWTQVDGGGSC